MTWLGILRCAVDQRRLLVRVALAFVRRETRSRASAWLAAVLVVGLAIVAGRSEVDGSLGHVASAVMPVLILACVYRRILHGLLVVPTLSVALCLAAWSALFGLASGFEELLIEHRLGTRGHLHVRKYGLDFEEFPAIAHALKRRSEILCILPAVQGSGVLRALSQDERAADGVGPREGRLLDDFREGRLVHIEGWPRPEADCSPAFEQILRSAEAPDWGALLRSANPGRLPSAVLARGLAERLGVRSGDPVELVVERDPALGRGALSTKLDHSGREHERLRHARFEVSAIVETGDPELNLRMVLIPLTAAQGLIFGRGRVSQLRLFLKRPSQAIDLAADIEAGLNRGKLHPVYRAHAHTDTESLRAGLRKFRFVVSVAAGACMAVCVLATLAGLIALLRRRAPSLRTLQQLGAPPLFDVVVRQALSLAIFVAGLGGALAVTALWSWHLKRHPLSLPIPGEVDELVYELGTRLHLSDIGIPAAVTYLLLSAAAALVPSADHAGTRSR